LRSSTRTPGHSREIELLTATSERSRPLRVLIHGLPHFCRKLTGLLRDNAWDVRYRSSSRSVGLAALANDLHGCDLAYTWGGRIDLGKFLWAARLLGKKKLVMLWSGSDVSYAKTDYLAGKMNPWVAEKIHWAVSPWIAEEVRSLGLACEYVQASFVEPVNDPAPLPEKFSVLVYLPSVDKAELYGWNQILEVARECRSINFVVVGLQNGESLQIPPNVTPHGWTEDLTPFLKRTTVLWRPVQHDGLSFMVLEALAHGRHVIYSYPLAGCVQAKGASAAREELERLFDLHLLKALSLNQKGIDIIARDFNPTKVRSEILQRWGKIIFSRENVSVGKLAAPTTGD
jgi:Glycosyl transferases group 1